MAKIYIINPTGTVKRTLTSKKRSAILRKRRKSKRSHASYVKAGKKASRTRKRRRNPTSHRITVKKTGRGKSARLRRSAGYRLKPRRVNPKRRRRSRVQLKGMVGRYFGRNRVQNAVLMLVGVGVGATLKGLLVNFAPVGASRDWAERLYGVASVILGVTVQANSRRKAVKSAGVGLVVFGVYDLIVSNTPLGDFLPTIGAPVGFQRAKAIAEEAEQANGYYGNFGQNTYAGMGAGINQGVPEVVGANISSGVAPEVIGDDYDLSDMLEMSA